MPSRSKPGGFFHGSACPAHTRSAPAATIASTSALTERRLGVGDQDLAEFRIAGHFAQLAIVSHVRGVLLRDRDQSGLSGAVEIGGNAHARRRRRAVAVQMGDDDRPAIEFDEAKPPRHALAIEQLVAVVEQRFGNELAAAVLRAPIEPAATGRRGRLRAADTAPCRNRGRLAARGARAPHPR